MTASSRAPATKRTTPPIGEIVALVTDDIAPRLAHIGHFMAHDVHVGGFQRFNGDRPHVLAAITPLSPVLDPLLAGKAMVEQGDGPQQPFALTLMASRLFEGMVKPFYERACPLIDGDPTSKNISDSLGMPTTYRSAYLDGLLPMRDGEWIPWLGPAPIAFDVIACRRSVTTMQVLRLARAAVRSLRRKPLRKARP